MLFDGNLAKALAGQFPDGAEGSELLMLRAVIEGLPDLIYVKDTQSRFLVANPAQRKFLTGKPDESGGISDYSCSAKVSCRWSSFFLYRNGRCHSWSR